MSDQNFYRIIENVSNYISKNHDNKVSNYNKELDMLNEIAITQTLIALENMNLFKNEKDTLALNLLEHSHIERSVFMRQMRRLLNLAVKAKILNQCSDNIYQRISAWPPITIVPYDVPLENSVLFDFVRGLSGHMTEILTGKILPAEILFKSGLMDTALKIYTDSTPFLYCNEVARIIMTDLIKLVTHPLCILEIGAGTGATTDVMVRSEGQAKYVFSDISNFFLHSAVQRYADQKHMDFILLNIEDTVSDAMIDSFDVIIAAHVLHATKNLKTTLGHVKSMLHKGGLLILLEETKLQPFFSVTMGLQSGFDRYKDTELRQHHPLLDENQWGELSLSMGFSGYKAFSDIMGIRPILIKN